jgi:KUP system potassium uptake protein
VIGFKTSAALGIAYGVSVTGTMLISAILTIVVASERWQVSSRILWPVGALFVGIDVGFLSANMVKFADGAWFPLALGVVAFAVMRTWRRGRELVRRQVRRDSLRIEHFIEGLMRDPPVRVAGTAVFMTASNDHLPPALLNNLEHNKVLHERNVLLSVETAGVPRCEAGEREQVTALGHGFWRLTLRFGYMEEPDVPRALRELDQPGLVFDLARTTFFASRESLTAKDDQGMALWRDKLFLLMSRNATPATDFFGIPGNRLVELGTQVAI